ncbi:hypothetical protein IJJ12_01430 [bacterium]|nr:hypothetical protein [bacterium]
MSETTAKKEYKECRDFKAWQAGHEFNQELQLWAQEYEDPKLDRWVFELLTSARESVVQVMEAFRKYHGPEKIRRYDAAIFYLNRIDYTLELGDELGWWKSGELRPKLDDYRRIIRSTLVKFIPKTDEKSSPETTIG